MSLSPTQMTQQVASINVSAASKNATAASPAAAPASPTAAVLATPLAAGSPADSPPSTPSLPAPNPISTNLRIDEQHQFYYEFVDDATGSVDFEIPPEALRALSESLQLPVDGSTHTVDVKS